MTTTTSVGNTPNTHFDKGVARTSRAFSWIWLLCATALLLFADGRNTIALAAWLAPVLLLRFVRTQPAKVGLVVAYFTLIFPRAIAMRGMIPIPGIFFYVFWIISGFSAFLPFLARWSLRNSSFPMDRWVVGDRPLIPRAGIYP
jgi:hypothetical protein